jgi:hypothetical protein
VGGILKPVFGGFFGAEAQWLSVNDAGYFLSAGIALTQSHYRFWIAGIFLYLLIIGAKFIETGRLEYCLCTSSTFDPYTRPVGLDE